MTPARPLSPQLQQMKEKKCLYPDKSVYTQQIGPGLCFGALALMLRFFFEVRGPGLLGGLRQLPLLPPLSLLVGGGRPPSHHSTARRPPALAVCGDLRGGTQQDGA